MSVRDTPWFVVLAVTFLVASPVFAQNISKPAAPMNEQRVALVIGNSAYAHAPLRNPVNDARAIADKLQRLGFKVIKRENPRAREIGPVLREFRSRLSANAVALFYYAGHAEPDPPLQVRHRRSGQLLWFACCQGGLITF